MQAPRTLYEKSVNIDIPTLRAPTEVLPLLSISFGVLVATALTITFMNKIGDFQQNTDEVEHACHVRFDLECTARITSDAQAAVRGFLLAGNLASLTPCAEAQTSLPQLVHSLDIQVSNNPSQQQPRLLLVGEIRHRRKSDLALSVTNTSLFKHAKVLALT